jgi:SAM-dependent methyltransferase
MPPPMPMIPLQRQIEPVLEHLSAEDRANVLRAWPAGHPVLRIAMRHLQAAGNRRGSGVGGVGEADFYRQLAQTLAEEADLYVRSGTYQIAFREFLAAEPGVNGRVLDIGCGSSLLTPVSLVPSLCKQLDGVDPSPAIHQHPHLTLRWQGRFEDADIPAEAYDLAYAYNVVEHIEAPRPFFEKLHRVLKPGGAFLAVTPHANHLFARLSRAIELMRGKHFMAARNPGVNDYPAFYRLNSQRQVRRAIQGLGFEAAFHYFAAPGWGCGYFPRGLRWFPRAYDWAIGDRFERASLILIYRLQRMT